MLIELADWKLEADVPLTMALSGSQAKEHCTCGYCKNFYAAIDRAYPMLRPFLLQFGIDIEGPDELCPFEPTIYEATYIIQGHIVQKGMQQLYLSDVPLMIRSAPESDICTEHPAPYFTLTVGLLELPWLLPDPMEDVISPANEEDFLERMQKKLLQRLAAEHILS